ncbi:hypothetical protein COU13_01770 [Candidatus Kaiserbacteria bacterium CG10_big_fil_rev_8_21_14_0_10_43_70]|uniref:Uncharacterized protein n=1 Tax=Candidatus Kaiserbacteria bacterium CG10_big_fil_rev_8_21_14_0_10_43_70 TaxID=1974605 RepID=A0A2H0UIT4_9BACT|nr:MAG: hypothetical protein COU13_01770 [Candidatus Kaiserbacteria bacterium CG10_big_fil_rev_8_21_14_0_10_43_70]
MRDINDGVEKDRVPASQTTTSVRVKVTPGASKEVFTKVGENSFEAFVREPAQKNMANRRVCELVAIYYGAPPEAARIKTGHRSRNKIINVKL